MFIAYIDHFLNFFILELYCANLIRMIKCYSPRRLNRPMLTDEYFFVTHGTSNALHSPQSIMFIFLVVFKLCPAMIAYNTLWITCFLGFISVNNLHKILLK